VRPDTGLSSSFCALANHKLSRTNKSVCEPNRASSNNDNWYLLVVGKYAPSVPSTKLWAA
jgi:hypothetical protein